MAGPGKTKPEQMGQAERGEWRERRRGIESWVREPARRGSSELDAYVVNLLHIRLLFARLVMDHISYIN